MAVLAAVIAAVITSAQLRHNKRQSERDRWWTTLTWIYERTARGTSSDGQSLPQGVTFSLLTALNDQAKERGGDQLRQKAIESFLSMFEDSEPSEPPAHPAASPEEVMSGEEGAETSAAQGRESPNGEGRAKYHEVKRRAAIAVDDPAAADLLTNLRNDLAHSPNLSVREHAFEFQVHEALLRLMRELAFITDVSRASLDLGADFIVRSASSTLAIEVKSARRPIGPKLVTSWAAQMGRHLRATPAVLVVNQPLTMAAQRVWRELEAPFDYVVWRGTADDPALRAAVYERLRAGTASNEH